MLGLPAHIHQEDDGSHEKFERVFQAIDTHDDKWISPEAWERFFVAHAAAAGAVAPNDSVAPAASSPRTAAKERPRTTVKIVEALEEESPAKAEPDLLSILGIDTTPTPAKDEIPPDKKSAVPVKAAAAMFQVCV